MRATVPNEIDGNRHEPSGAAQLRRHRADAGLTQEQLAELASVAVRTVRGLESAHIARPRLGTANALADALSLSTRSRARFLDAWHLYDPRTSGPAGPIEAALARSRRDLRIIAVLETTVLGRDRRPRHRRTEEVMVAQADDVRERTIHYAPMDESVDLQRLRLSGTDGCKVVDETIDGDGAGKFFRVALDAELSRGDTHVTRYTANFGAARRSADSVPREHEGLELAGFAHSPALYVLEVRFRPSDVPKHCRQIFQARPWAQCRAVAPVVADARGIARVTMTNPRPGGHGLQWAW